MTRGEVGWCIALAGLPFAYLLRGILRLELDVWHFQTAWMQAWLIGLFAYSLWQGQLAQLPKPLILWLAWLCLHAWWVWNRNLVSGQQYPVQLLVPLTHIVFLLMAFLSMTWRSESLPALLTTLRWMGMAVVVYCGLQVLGLDEFLRGRAVERTIELVGPIGNQTFLSAYLAILLPLYLFASRRWLGMAGACLLVIGVLAKLHQSATGVLVATGGLIWWTAWRFRWWAMAWVPVLLGGAWWSYRAIPDLWISTGRLPAWKAMWPIFAKHFPITGLGLGSLHLLSEQITDGPLLQWRHLHNEFYQVAVEHGVVGFGLMVATLIASFRRFLQVEKTDLSLTLAGMWLAFLVTCTTLFPAHLWTLGSLGLVAYGGLYRLPLKDAPAWLS